MESPLAGIRAGAVQELTGLLRGRHAGMALAARLALEQLSTSLVSKPVTDTVLAWDFPTRHDSDNRGSW